MSQRQTFGRGRPASKYSVRGGRTLDDFLFSEDQEFNETFRLTRKTVRYLVADLKRLGYRPTGGRFPTEHALLLLLWYLGGRDRDLASAAKIFGLVSVVDEDQDESRKLARSALVDIATAVSTLLPELAGVTWPTHHELTEIESNLKRRYQVPTLAGLLGFFGFTTNPDGVASTSTSTRDTRELIALQAVIDDKMMWRDLQAKLVSKWVSAAKILYDSPLYNRLMALSETRKLHLLAGKVYPRWRFLFTPFQDDGKLSEEELWLNETHYAVMGILRETYRALLNRFPRLEALDLDGNGSMATILASAVLHNYSLLYRDEALIRASRFH